MLASDSSVRRRLIPAVILLVVLLAGFWLGGHPSMLPAGLRTGFFQERSNPLVDESLSKLTSQYYRPLERSALVDKGLTAMVASLGDPYSHYYDPASYRAFLDQSNPHVSGIGVDVRIEQAGLRIVDVFPGSPAARADMMRDDLIVKVGTTSLAGHPPELGTQLIRGRPGTPVTLTVQRGVRRLVVRIVRANAVVPVTSEHNLSFHGTRIGYVQLTSFTQGSGSELRSQVQKALRAHAQALVLDLRENGGGLLDEAVSVASIFVADGTIVSTAGRSQPRQVYVATGNAVAPRLPLVVLVDRGTASAAEIVTGALQDRGRAKVVGTHTYGKGVFQEIEPLSNGGALDITVGEYFTPSGRNLGGGGVREGAGITPNVYASTNPRASVDEALQVAERTVAVEVR